MTAFPETLRRHLTTGLGSPNGDLLADFFADFASTASGKGASGIGIQDSAGLITGTTVEAALAELVARLPTNTIADPGDAAAIPVTKSGWIAFTIANAAETNTLAIPSFAGQLLILSVAALTGSGTRAITSAQSIDDGGTTVLTLRSNSGIIVLLGVQIAGALRWRRIGTPNAGSRVDQITDPGNAGAIPVTRSGYCPLVSAGAETRTLAAPQFINQRILLYMKTDGGDIVLTCATTVNETGNNTVTFDNTGEAIELVAVEEGANLRWRAVFADGAALSTV